MREGFPISDDPARLDVAAIHGYLSRCYWAEAIPLEEAEPDRHLEIASPGLSRTPAAGGETAS